MSFLKIKNLKIMINTGGELPEIIYNDASDLIELFNVNNIELANTMLYQISASLDNNENCSKLFKLKHAADYDNLSVTVFKLNRERWGDGLNMLFNIYNNSENYEKCALINKMKKKLK